MKGCMVVFAGIICITLLVKIFNRPNKVFNRMVTGQNNPFVTTPDSSELMWRRAVRFIELNERIIAGADPVYHDSVITVPYASSHKKGNSIRIARKQVAGGIEFSCSWWYSGELDEDGGKEIALYIQTKRARYDE